MNLGNKILKIRKDNKMSQEEFATILNVTRQTVSNWEIGNNYPDIETLITISDKFNVSLDLLLKGDKEMIKDINKKVKKNKVLKRIIIALIIVLIIVIIGFVVSFKVYNCWKIYNNFQEEPESRLTNKCNLNDKRLKLAAQIRPECNYEYKKWYEVPCCYADYDTKPFGYFIVDNNTKEMQKDLMENSNINVEDYDNAYDLLEDMEDYIINIGGTCDNR